MLVRVVEKSLVWQLAVVSEIQAEGEQETSKDTWNSDKVVAPPAPT